MGSMTTYLRNTWYAAAWADEVSAERPFARTLLDEPLVFYRDGAGHPVAFVDRCPHRFAPLSKGKLIGEAIQCPYHGLQFGSNGRCTHNPHGSIPPTAKLTGYPLLERYGLIWIWMGDAQSADAEKLPDFSIITDTDKYAVVSGKLTIDANYQLGVDNLLDLSHAQFLHPLLGNPDSSERSRFSTRIEGTTVWALTDMPNEPVTKLFQMMWRSPATVGDRRIHMRWDPPANLLLDVGFTECDRPTSEGPSMPSAHLLTPETERTTHYFWAAARDSLRDDVALSEKIRSGIDGAFRNEDGPMIADCQDRMGTTDLMSLKPLLLKSDAAAVSARRVLAKLIEQELGTPLVSSRRARDSAHRGDAA
jgi:phenylpropionate dioxygenase-like ring-hydroxylating dioxygenase large terminal subunit